MSLADLLRTHREALLSRWRAKVGPSGGELREHVSELLSHLEDALRQGAPGDTGALRARARQHRPPLRPDADVEAVVREYGLLRETLMGVLREVGARPSWDELDGLAVFFEEGVTGAVEQARRELARLRLVTDSLPVLVSYVTADERYGLVNHAYEGWFGLTREALLGKTLREVIGEAAYAVLGPHVRRGLAGESFSFEQYGVPYRLGGRRDVRVSFVSHRDERGLPDGYIALLEDITARRQLEAERDRLALQRTEILEQMGDGFLALDREWRLVLVNRHLEQVTATRREDTLGRRVWEVFPAWAAPTSVFWREMHRCMEERVEVRFVVGGAEHDVWTDVRAFPTRDGGLAVFFRDVTPEKRAEALLRRQSEFEQQLIGIVSHDLRNPLTAIQMGAALLVRRETLDPRDFKTLERLQASTARALRLVRDLLDFTQARLGGGIPLHREPGGLHALTRGVLDEMAAANPGREVVLHSTGDDAGHWDLDRLGQVVQNLVTNALKYSPEGSRVQVETQGGEDGVVLAVHNGGEPIAGDRLASLFQPMRRGVEGPDGAGGSVGLGLYIVRSIVEAHGGTVEVTSSADAGTRFTVRLPRGAPPG